MLLGAPLGQTALLGFALETLPIVEDRRTNVRKDRARFPQAAQVQVNLLHVSLDNLPAQHAQLFLRILDISGDVLQREANLGHKVLLERRTATFMNWLTQADSGSCSGNRESVVDARNSVKKDCAATLSFDHDGSRVKSSVAACNVGQNRPRLPLRISISRLIRQPG